MEREDPEKDVCHPVYWEKETEKKGVEYVENIAAEKSGKMREAALMAVERYYRKQKDRSDAETLQVARSAKLASWIAVCAAALSILVTIATCSST